MERSAAYSFIKQRLVREFRVLDQEQVTPWAFLRTQSGVRVKKFDGGNICLAGVEFEGDPRDLFWGDYIRLFLEDIISRGFEETRRFCIEHSLERVQPLEDTGLELQGGASRIYNRMAEIDRRLRGKGFPDSVPPYDPLREIESIRKFIWQRQDAEVALIQKTITNTSREQTSTTMNHDYDVALSFAGEQRAYVEEVAQYLRASSLSVFYDRFEEADLWGKNLYQHLAEVYGKKARYTVIFCSKEYVAKAWTNHERQAAQDRAFRENKEYILPARFDDTEVPGILSTIGHLDLRTRSPQQLGEIIVTKVRGVQKADDIPKSQAGPSSFSPEAQELLELMEREGEDAEKGLVEIMQPLSPGMTALFPKLIYSGTPLMMKSRLFRGAVDELIAKQHLYPPEYDGNTNTKTYEFRSPLLIQSAPKDPARDERLRQAKVSLRELIAKVEDSHAGYLFKVHEEVSKQLRRLERSVIDDLAADKREEFVRACAAFVNSTDEECQPEVTIAPFDRKRTPDEEAVELANWKKPGELLKSRLIAVLQLL